jgi:hypothetical protein
VCPGSWLPKGYQGEAEGAKPLIFTHFHEVFFGSQHEIWSKQHNGKVSPRTLKEVGQQYPGVFWWLCGMDGLACCTTDTVKHAASHRQTGADPQQVLR